MPGLPEYLEIKQTALATLRERLSSPDAAPLPLTATARVAGLSGVRAVTVRGFTVVSDSGPALAGHDLGPSAPELLLSALASCLAHTYLVVGAGRGVAYRALEVEVRGSIDFRGLLEVSGDASIPPSELSYEARIDADVPPEEIEAIRREVERLCPVLQAVLRPMPVAGRAVGTGAESA